MSPLAHPDGFDAGWLVDQLVPSITAMIDNFVVGFEDVVGEPVIPHELPDVFDRIEFWAFGWQRNDADILGYDERLGHMPPSLIHDHRSMGAKCHGSGDFDKMQVHRLCIAERQDKPCALAKGRADRSEDVGRCGSLIMWCGGPCSTLCPSARDLVFLTDSGLVLEPDFYRSALWQARADFFQFGCKPPFLNASSASMSCEWWRGRAVSLT